MVGLFAVIRHEGKLHAVIAGPIFKVIEIILPDSFAPGLNTLTGFKLSIKEGCENIRRQVTRSDVHPCVLVHLTAEETAAIGSLFANNLGTFDILRIVNQQGSAFTASEILCLME